MKKSKLFSLIMLVAFCFTLTPVLAQVNDHQQIRGTVSNVSKYGNLTIDLSPSVLTDAGYEYGDLMLVSVGDVVIKAPFCTSYSDVDTGNPLVRDDQDGNVLIVAINMGNFSKTHNVVAGDEISFSLNEKYAYLNEYLIRQLDRSYDRSDYASDSIFANFRNIQLGQIPQGVFYRSSSPVNNEIKRAAWADSLSDAFKIQTVINLADSKNKIDSFIADDQFDSPYYLSLYEKGQVKYLDMGVDLVSEDFGQKLVQGMRFIIEKEGPYLIHCTEGKDRVGFASAVVEGLMGASIDEIIADYMLTYQNYYNVEKGSEQYHAIARSNIISSISLLLGNKKAVDLSEVDLVKAAESYLQRFGLSPAEIAALKVRLSTVPAGTSVSTVGMIKEIEKYGHTSTDIAIDDFYRAGFKLGDMVTVTYDNGYTLEAPFLDGYYVENGMPLVRAYPGHETVAVCINYGKLNQVADVDTGNKLTISLSKKAAYLDEYSIRSLKRTNEREDYASDSIFSNFRAISQGNIDPKILYRSSSPVNPELGRASYTDTLIEAAGIASVVNMADSKEEVESYISSEGFDSFYYADLFAKGRVITLDMDIAYIGERFKLAVAQAGKFIVANEAPYLIHCTEGKDRAGFFSAMLEALMNATVDEIVADYMISYSNYYGVTPGSEKYQIISGDVINMLKYVADTEDLKMADLPTAVKAYLMEGGMTSTEVEQLKAVLSGSSRTSTITNSRTEHIVVSGDTLWALAVKYLGTGFRYGEIFKINDQIIKDPSLIYVGQKLQIPEK